ncbi:MAG TPA: hypothetical protein VLY85_03845, partial [Thermoplasmata archaeon]|nr:hypothetical protein [Thermoplasmata archaeon]
VGRVEAVTSGDAGQTWSPVQLVQAKGESIPSQEGVEIAQGNQGLVLAFGLASNSNDTSQLGLWTYSSQSLAGFVPTTILPAPTSWTLQGSSDSLAYLLTPSYLIPLTSPPYTALPFNQLQADGTSVGMLPHVVSLVPLGSGRVEVAATTPDSLGVDCWVFDTTVASVTQTCHVSLDATLLPESQTLPIVSLIDGGGWWTAIGASGNQCGYDCPEPTYPGGWNFTAAPVAGSAAVGTSVCITGCSSAEGLAAYSFSQATSASQGAVGAAAGALLGLGLLWLAIWALATPRARARDDGPSPSGVSPTASGGTERADRRQIRRAYLGGLGVWVLVWTPFVLIALFASSTADSTTLAGVILLSAVVGAAVTIPFHGSARSRLQTMHGVTTGELLGGAHPPFPKPAFERVQRAAYYAYGSWAAGAALLIVLMIDVASGLPTTAGSTPGSGTGGIAPAPGWIVLGAIAVLFAGLRALYHYNLIRAATTPVAEESGEVELDAVDGPSIRRTQVGAALVPLSPFVGFLLGLVLQTVVPASPYLLAGLFVPLNFLGIAVLLGCFGPTVWSSAGADGPPADPPALGSTGPGIAHV